MMYLLLILFQEIIALYFENHETFTNALCGQNAVFNTLQLAVYIITT
jgi:hypothetical protein